MPLVEYVGGYQDGKRVEVPILDERLGELLDDGSSRTEYVRGHRLTPDGLAEIYYHQDLDQVYIPELHRTVAHLRAEFPDHMIDYKVTENSVDFTIIHDGKAQESSISNGLRRWSRPNMFDICQYIRMECKKSNPSSPDSQ